MYDEASKLKTLQLQIFTVYLNSITFKIFMFFKQAIFYFVFKNDAKYARWKNVQRLLKPCLHVA